MSGMSGMSAGTVIAMSAMSAEGSLEEGFPCRREARRWHPSCFSERPQRHTPMPVAFLEDGSPARPLRAPAEGDS